MDKKDIYEHLAKIYLDASSKTSKKKKKSKAYPNLFRNLFISTSTVVLVLVISLVFSFSKHRGFGSETALVLLPDAAKINFNFDPAKKEIFSMDLKNLNLGMYKALAFAIKNVNPNNKISLRVEFTNTFKERSEVYVRDIPGKWHDYKINLWEFKNIRDWSEMTKLFFAVEEWNTKENSGVLYLDNVRVLK